MLQMMIVTSTQDISFIPVHAMTPKEGFKEGSKRRSKSVQTERRAFHQAKLFYCQRGRDMLGGIFRKYDVSSASWGNDSVVFEAKVLSWNTRNNTQSFEKKTIQNQRKASARCGGYDHTIPLQGHQGLYKFIF